MTLSDFVKEYRKEHDLSQRQFAAICGLSNGYISMLERNLNPKTGLPLTPSLPALKKISTAMGMSLGDLLTAVDDMPIDLLSDISEDCANELSALTKEGGPMDDMDIALTTLILQLSPEKKAEALHYLPYLANRQAGCLPLSFCPGPVFLQSEVLRLLLCSKASNQLQSYILAGGVCKDCNRNAHAFAQKEIKSLLTNNDILLLYDGKLEVIL